MPIKHSKASDIYSLGIFFLRVLTSSTLTKPLSDQALKIYLQDLPKYLKNFYGHISSKVQELILSCLKKEPSERPNILAVNQILLEFSSFPGNSEYQIQKEEFDNIVANVHSIRKTSQFISDIQISDLSIGNSLTELQDQISAVDQKLTTDVNVLKSDVNVLKSDVALIKTDLSLLKTEVTSVKDDLSSQIGHLNSAMADGFQVVLKKLDGIK